MSESIQMTATHPLVAEFYANKSIFITGATGFIGKVMLEKLLYNCKDVDNVFILVRDKKGIDANTRINELKNVPIFERLKAEAPEQFDKIKPVAGDITKPGLGISDEDLRVLVEKVTVVFHVAAAMNFTDSLKKSFTHNVLPTREVMKLCHLLKKIEVLIYVSTAYANMDRSVIEEKVYEPPVDVATIEYMANNNMDDKFKKEILGGHPNTYVYTKLLAEHIVRNEHGDIPVAIVRPSIVASSLHGPNKGWMDNYNAASMIIAGIQTGASRIILLEGEKVCDLVPVDLVANFLIVCASRTSAPEVKVYNFTSGASNPVTWGEFCTTVVRSSFKYASWFPWAFVIPVGTPRVYFPLAFIFQLLPSYLVHFVLLLSGKKSRLLDIQDRLMKFAAVTHPFISQQWLWSDRNVREMLGTLSQNDQKVFDIDVKHIDWNTYFVDYTQGVKRYLLKMSS